MVVSVEHAFYWECPKCKAENFHKGIVPTIDTEEEEEEVREALLDLEMADIYEEITQEMLNQLIMMPRKVVCPKCNSEFDSISPDE